MGHGERQASTRSLRLSVLRIKHRSKRLVPLVVGALAIAALGGGVVVLFGTPHEARSAFLLSLGLALGLFALVGGRVQLEGFEILGAKLRVREVVKRRLELAASPEHGSAADGAALRRQAAVLQRLVGLHGLYEHIRRVEPPGPHRTQNLDLLAASMQKAGRGAEFDPAEVIGWFHEGTDPLRVIALNLMLVNEEYRDFVAVIEAIDDPHSLFEQFYALALALEMATASELDSLQRRLLGEALARARGKRRFRRDGPLMELSEELLGRLAAAG